jgi:hypothetical protein
MPAQSLLASPLPTEIISWEARGQLPAQRPLHGHVTLLHGAYYACTTCSLQVRLHLVMQPGDGSWEDQGGPQHSISAVRVLWQLMPQDIAVKRASWCAVAEAQPGATLDIVHQGVMWVCRPSAIQLGTDYCLSGFARLHPPS